MISRNFLIINACEFLFCEKVSLDLFVSLKRNADLCISEKPQKTIDMEVKKSEKASLENKKLLFTEIGLVAALGIVWGAFEYSSKEAQVAVLEDTTQVLVEEEMVAIQNETPPPPPEAPNIPVLSDQIDIVDDDIKLDDDMFMNLEDDNTGVEIMDYKEAEVVEEEVEEEAIPFQLVEQKPSFQGGDANEFSKWVNSKLVYPEIAKENGVQGRVTLQFTVEADGRVTNVKVLRGVDESLDKEAVRVVSSSPKWTPGRQRDRAVKVTYTFPVIFQLR
jgi:TonB family C-terminal domain